MSAIGRPGFMVFFAEWEALDDLDDAQFRKVFRAALCYAHTGHELEIDDPMSKLAFQMLKPRLDEDAARYARKVEQARMAGNRSKEAAANARRRASTDVDERGRASTDSTNTNANDNGNTNLSQRRDDFEPTVDEVKSYAREAGLHVDAQQFVTLNRASGWLDGDGNPIRDWRR